MFFLNMGGAGGPPPPPIPIMGGGGGGPPMPIIGGGGGGGPPAMPIMGGGGGGPDVMPGRPIIIMGGGGGGAIEGAKVASSVVVRSVKSRSFICSGRLSMRLAIWAVSMDRSNVSMALAACWAAAAAAPELAGLAAGVLAVVRPFDDVKKCFKIKANNNKQILRQALIKSESYLLWPC